MDGQKAVEATSHVWIAIVVSILALQHSCSKDSQPRYTVVPKGDQYELTVDKEDGAGFRLIQTYTMTPKKLEEFLAEARATAKAKR
jgi:hypothetical protein